MPNAVVTPQYVDDKLKSISTNKDLSAFISIKYDKRRKFMSLLSKNERVKHVTSKHKGIAVDFKDAYKTISSVTVTNVFMVTAMR